ncbi:MAG: SRPBCC family protein [Phycisphaerales bacterium]|nr:SRPBCC family protein [Phycisphaerales bacterium]
MPVFTKQSTINAPASLVFAWHQSADALTRLIPPWEHVVVEQAPASLANGQRAILRLSIGPVKLRWIAEHTGFIDRGPDGGEFSDFQVSGPFKSWAHRHSVTALSPTTCTLTDHIDYQLPLGWLGRAFGGAITRRKLEKMFAFRHQVTREQNETAATSPSTTR